MDPFQQLQRPYALFLGREIIPIDAKTVLGLAYWRP
jgi:hypothetical protein